MKKNNCFFPLIFLILLIVAGCAEEPPPAAPQAEAEKKVEEQIDGVIAAVGDSLTEGLGVDEDLAYPAVLERKLRQQGYRYRVVNAGNSGETSSGTLSRIKWVLTLKPDIVILVIGANDGFRGIDIGLIKSNITAIIQTLKENNVTVVLGGMQIVQNLGRDYTTAFAGIYPEIARSEDVIFIPFFLADVAADRSLNQADGIHPNAAGYRRIVETVYPYVVEAIKVHESRIN